MGRDKPLYDGHNKRSLKGASRRDLSRRRGRRRVKQVWRDLVSRHVWDGRKE